MASSLSRGKTTMNIIKANPALVSLIFGYLSFRAQPVGGMLEKKNKLPIPLLVSALQYRSSHVAIACQRMLQLLSLHHNNVFIKKN